jgi:hypothetical protein
LKANDMRPKYKVIREPNLSKSPSIFARLPSKKLVEQFRGLIRVKR